MEIAGRGRLPVVAGGTGFYVRSLLFGMPSAPAADPGIRASVAADLTGLGSEALREELRARDPTSAARIHSNDLYRLTRAVEILRATGRSPGDFASRGRLRDDRDILLLWLSRPRSELRERIGSRVDAMFEAGLAAEFEGLRDAGYGSEDPGMQAIGYREFFELGAEGLRGFPAAAGSGTAGMTTNEAFLEAVRARIVLDTMRYAKRQETFFRGLPGIRRIEAGPSPASDIAALIAPLLVTALAGA
jgi:tRNA dimethylallyltransferase